jgi:hypothetical protein
MRAESDRVRQCIPFRGVAVLAGAVLAASGLAACGTSSGGSGPVTLNYYIYPDTSGATNQAVAAVRPAIRSRVPHGCT